jgi:hypothetical protein
LVLGNADLEAQTERYAMMAMRTKSTSLKRRFMWTIGSFAMIALVSVVSIISYRSSQHPPVNQEPGLLANVGADPNAHEMTATEDSTAIDSPQPKDLRVVQTAAFQSEDKSSASDNDQTADHSADAPFIEQNPGAIPAGNFRSSRYGYAMNLAGTDWTRWTDLAAIMPDAEYGALLKNYGRFLVMPLQLADANPSSDVVDRTMLAQFGFQYPDARSTDAETFQRWGTEVHVFRISRDVSGRENVYRMWILRRNRVAYLVAAWIDRTAAMNQFAASTAGSHGKQPSASAIDGEQLDNVIDAQLDAVLARFRLNDPPSAAQSNSNQRQPIRTLVRYFRILPFIGDR